MNKHEYLAELNKELKKLPDEERQNAIQYYMEYFDDAGPENEQRVIMELGHPKDVANTLLSDYAIKRMNAPSTVPNKKNFSVLKWIVVALVASPIALPVVFALICAILCVLLMVFCITAACAVMSIVGSAAGVVGCAAAIYLLVLHDPATFLLFAGIGLLGIACSILLGMAGICLAKLTIQFIRKFVTFIVERRKRKDEKRKEKNEAVN